MKDKSTVFANLYCFNYRLCLRFGFLQQQMNNGSYNFVLNCYPLQNYTKLIVTDKSRINFLIELSLKIIVCWELWCPRELPKLLIQQNKTTRSITIQI